ncbi:GntT/GntP/DsdX family permease [Halomonas salipaludis]|uniref:GntP family gluconate:H+ symporter n=1 Tax=Halomonas salipaludis TaxID=2032625 RepID=A0A2A2ESK1_9GAMM|nr:hypothetical protein [Halomonas salipaludis]PAU75540.1 hypothetical protein CK498_16565 [Halomonas salipaludis]
MRVIIPGLNNKANGLPDLPLVIWMILVTLLCGVLAGYDASALISGFNQGYGASIGEFALILIPSFVLAAAIEQQRIDMSPRVSVGMAPFSAAGMVCPDTAYAALSPMCLQRKLPMAFGAFAGFKLLFPAGPLIVAASVAADTSTTLLLSVTIFIPVWLTGLLYGRMIEDRILGQPVHTGARLQISYSSLCALLPFLILAILLVIGVLFDMRFNVWADFVTNPKGALIVSAAVALAKIPASDRRPAVDKGVRRAAELLVIIGAASAFSMVVTSVVPVEEIFMGSTSELVTLLTLFLLTAAFKVLQGSSMSVFAAVGPIAAPIVAAAGISPVLAALAICLGSFIAILPNDSFYWLVRQDAMPDKSELVVTSALVAGAVLQALVGMVLLLALAAFNIF